jgi:hypothetical protein
MGSEKATIIKRTNPRLWDFLRPSFASLAIDVPTNYSGRRRFGTSLNAK